MASGSADTYARNLNRQEGDWTGGSPQSAFMTLHEQGAAMIDGRLFGLIQGRPMELTDELIAEMSGSEFTPMPGVEGYGQRNQGHSGYRGGMQASGIGEGGMGSAHRPPVGSTDVGDRPHGALPGADLAQQPEMLSDMGTPGYARQGYAPDNPRGRDGQGAAADHRQGVEDEYNYWLKQDEMDRQRGRADSFASDGVAPGARLVPRDTNRGAGPPPALTPGGSSYEESYRR
jgi:hypothetical protein